LFNTCKDTFQRKSLSGCQNSERKIKKVRSEKQFSDYKLISLIDTSHGKKEGFLAKFLGKRVFLEH